MSRPVLQSIHCEGVPPGIRKMAPGITASLEASARLDISRASIGRTDDSALKPKKADGTERCDPAGTAVALLGAGTAAAAGPTDTLHPITAPRAKQKLIAALSVQLFRQRHFVATADLTSKVSDVAGPVRILRIWFTLPISSATPIHPISANPPAECDS
jgi:hypothetical protein